MVRALGWLVLSLVFVDEVLAAVAAGVWGGYAAGPPLAVAMPVLVVALWWTFASPRAPLGGPVIRPVVRVLVFGLAGAGLWAAGHHGWALAFLVYSVVVNGLAQLGPVRALLPEPRSHG